MLPHYEEHAAFIWSAYAIAAAVLVALAVLVVWRGHAARKRLAQARATLAALRPGSTTPDDDA